MQLLVTYLVRSLYFLRNLMYLFENYWRGNINGINPIINLVLFDAIPFLIIGTYPFGLLSKCYFLPKDVGGVACGRAFGHA